MEVWKDVPGYEGMYQVSDMGRVKSVDRVSHHPSSGYITLRGKICEGHKDAKGYVTVRLCKLGKVKDFRVHRLVASAFLGLDILYVYGQNVVCHKNDVPYDNRLDNLFVGTQKDNIVDMYRKKRGVDNKGEKHGLSKLTNAIVKQIKQMIADGKDTKEIAEKFGIKENHVVCIRLGRIWKSVNI